MSYLTHIENAGGERLDPGVPLSAPPSEQLRARYDFDRLRREVTREAIERGPASLWRYAPLLPLERPERAISLAEGWTPLVPAPRLARALGMKRLAVKDEGRNPSGTFKDRGAAVAVSRYLELGVKTVAHNSSGNAGGSWSLYAARAGITCVNILPTDAQPASRQHCRASGQPTFLLENWHDGGRLVAEACERSG
jgi:threonine synthase